MLKPICFYLPQFHPVKENDEWWGEGFTEWRNVARGTPNFPDHYQPHVPAELGYYDLRVVEVQKRQADLARAHGIHGFCYYHYWFNGRRILERPLEQLQAHPEIDFPFCVCWANENWTRTWDGKEDDILLAQHHTPEDDEAFLRSLLPLFRDPRYIRVGGKPLLAVYRVDLFPDAKRTARLWREIAAREGLDGLHLCAIQFYGVDDPRPWGFDAAIEFPPHQFIGPENRPDEVPGFSNPRFRGGLVDYRKIVSQALKRPVPDYLVYRGVLPSWDNTARRQDTPHTVVGSTPADYQHWLRAVADQTRQGRPRDEQFVFINAWNEWGEGCHLEPDVRHGRAWLEATRAAVKGYRAIDELVAGLKLQSDNDPAVLDGIVEALNARERSLYALEHVVRRKNVQLEELRRRLERSPPSSTAGSALVSLAKSGVRRLPVLQRELERHPRLKNAIKKLLAPLSTGETP